ncbi:MAG: AAA family ATPase, partial [Syntrophomonadaceae bacterium]|nr:AAA family ATPase [Syntrophomonadaceae bacterium]
DILILAEHFAKSIGSRIGKNINKIDPKTIDAFLNYDWPGNVRELSNVIERGINLAQLKHEKILTTDLLPPEIQEAALNNVSLWEKTPTKETWEEQLIRNYLVKFNNNKSKVAEALNISRSSLYRKMDKYNIDKNPVAYRNNSN